MKRAFAAAAIIVPLLAAGSASAADKVVVVMGKTSSNLPYYVADARGFFKEFGIEPEQKIIIDNSLVIAALIADQAEAAASVLAIDGMNANLKKPGAVNWITINAQNDPHKMEQFVIRAGFKATTVADLKGARIACAPGLGNLSMAKAALAKAGLVGRRLQARPDGSEPAHQRAAVGPVRCRLHARAGRHHDAQGRRRHDAAERRDRAGRARRRQGQRLCRRRGGHRRVPKNRPEVAKRYAQAWAKAIEFINDSPDEARKYLLNNTPIPESIVAEVPIVLFTYGRRCDRQATRRTCRPISITR